MLLLLHLEESESESKEKVSKLQQEVTEQNDFHHHARSSFGYDNDQIVGNKCRCSPDWLVRDSTGVEMD